MGLSGVLKKRKVTRHLRPLVMWATATYENWEQFPIEKIQEFTEKMIKKIEEDHPLYKYERSTFDFTHSGNINFKFIMRLRQ